MELDDVTGALLAFRQRKKSIDENSQGEGLVVKGTYECGRSSNRGELKGKNSRSKSDECCLVLNRTPLFMFVKPLVVLLSNMLICFSVFWYCRSLR